MHIQWFCCLMVVCGVVICRLVCTALYSDGNGERKYLPQFFKFIVANSLSRRTKVCFLCRECVNSVIKFKWLRVVSARGSVALLLCVFRNFRVRFGWLFLDFYSNICFCAVISLAGPRCQGNVQLFSTVSEDPVWINMWCF